MTVGEIRPEYQASVERMVQQLESGTPLGDPAKAAQTILRISEVADPPLRLLLGSVAFHIARAADEAKIDSDDRWKELTLSTDANDSELHLDKLRQVRANQV
jgi:hypothetical protein